MNTMKAGVSKIDITPEVGGWLQGYTRDKVSEGIFERLYAKALVFDNESERCVLLTSDLLGVTSQITDKVRKGIIKKCKGLKPWNIMVTATHTHCGPAVLDNINDFSVVDKKYIRTLTEKMIAVVLAACDDLEPVQLGVASGKSYININRRLMTPKGLQFAPNPHGPCDHEVGVVRIDDLANRPKAILINFSCHPTVWGGQMISPDYPGLTQKTVEKAFKESIALFTNGACGDVRPCFVKGPKPKTFGGGTSKAVLKAGTELGREVIRIAKKIKTHRNNCLGSVSDTIRFPLERPMSVASLKKEVALQTEKYKQAKKENQSPLMILWEKGLLKWAKDSLKIVEGKKFKPWVEGEIQVLCIGGIYFVGLPGEIMCEIGLAIKKNLKPMRSFIAAFANGCIGYVPTPKALIEGGYEPTDSIKTFNRPARFSPRVQSVIEKSVEKLYKKI